MKSALTLIPLVTMLGMVTAHAEIQYITNDTLKVPMESSEYHGGFSTVATPAMRNVDEDGEYEEAPSTSANVALAIQNLTRQTQQKEDSLGTALAQRLSMSSSSNPFMAPSVSVTSYNGNGMLAVRPITSDARMTSGFSYRYLFGRTRLHKGIDFAAPIGTPIYATGNGVVTYSGWGNGYGRYVEIDHGNGTVTRYGHTSANYVNTGDIVTANQHIADVGSTGHSTGPHLHYEVRQNGQAVNPMSYLAMAPSR